MGRTQHELAQELSEELGISFRTARRFLQRLLQKVADDLVDTGRVELRGLGIFYTVERPPQRIRHPRTGDPIEVPTYRVVEYRASQRLRQRLLEEAQRRARRGRKKRI